MIELIGLAVSAVGLAGSLYNQGQAADAASSQSEAQQKAAAAKYAADQEMYKAKQQVYGAAQNLYSTQTQVNADISAGQDVQYQGRQDYVQSQRDILVQQQEMEAIRERAMGLDFTRRQREAVRLMVADQARARATATNQGAMRSSSLQGAYAGASGRTGVTLTGLSQSLLAGQSMFAANRNITAAQLRGTDAQSLANQGQSQINAAQSRGAEAANLFASQRDAFMAAGETEANKYMGQAYSATSEANYFGSLVQQNMSEANMWAGLGSLGGAITKNAEPISKVGTFVGSKLSGTAPAGNVDYAAASSTNNWYQSPGLTYGVGGR